MIVGASVLCALYHFKSRGSIVVSIPACHAGDPGSIPGRGAVFLLLLCIFL